MLTPWRKSPQASQVLGRVGITILMQFWRSTANWSHGICTVLCALKPAPILGLLSSALSGNQTSYPRGVQWKPPNWKKHILFSLNETTLFNPTRKGTSTNKIISISFTPKVDKARKARIFVAPKLLTVLLRDFANGNKA